jgi:hypothetical protein
LVGIFITFSTLAGADSIAASSGKGSTSDANSSENFIGSDG